MDSTGEVKNAMCGVLAFNKHCMCIMSEFSSKELQKHRDTGEEKPMGNGLSEMDYNLEQTTVYYVHTIEAVSLLHKDDLGLFGLKLILVAWNWCTVTFAG